MQVMLPVTLLLFFGYITKTNGGFADSKAVRLMLAILGSAALSMLSCLVLSPEAISSTTIVRFFYFATILVYFVVATDRSYNQTDVRFIISGNIVCGVIIALVVLLRYVAGATGKVTVVSVWGVDIEENYTAALLAFDCILAILAFVRTKEIHFRLILLVAFLIIVFGIAYTGSRAALLSTFLSLGVMLLGLVFASGVDGVFLRLPATLAVLAVLLLFLVPGALDSLPAWYVDRFFNNSYIDGSNIERIQLWLNGLSGFLERPLFGYGIGNFAYFTRTVFFSMQGYGVVVAHNTYIDTLVDLGLVGFALVFIFIFRKLNFCVALRSFEFVSLAIVMVATSFIVGGERAFFFWNALVVLSMLSQVRRPEEIHESLDLAGRANG